MAKILYLFFRRILLGFFSLFTLWMRKKPFPAGTIQSILIFADYRIGDSVLAFPAISAIRKHFPSAKITALVNAGSADVWRMHEAVDIVETFQAESSYMHKLKSVCSHKKKPFDLSIDFTCDYTLLGAFVLMLSGARFRIGYTIDGRGLFFNRAIVRRFRTMHVVDEISDLARAAGAEPGDPVPRIRLSSQQCEKSKEMLTALGMGKKPLLGIHAGGTYPTQQWPAERFASVADKLAGQYDMQIVLFGGGNDEKKQLDQLAALMKSKPQQFYNQSLDVTAAVIRQCRLMICNNSGILHLAAATGVPTISFMGPTVAHRWWPAGQGHIVIRKNLPCIGCNSGRCLVKTFDCMKRITVDEVAEAAERILSAARAE